MDEEKTMTTIEQEGMSESSSEGSDYGLGMIAGAVLTAAGFGAVKFGKWIYKKVKSRKPKEDNVVVLKEEDVAEVKTEETKKK